MANPQADSLIESGQPLKKVIPVFSTKVEAYEYFARSMTRRFASPEAHCAGCGRDCETPAVRFTWRANVHTAKTVLLSFLFTIALLVAGHVFSRCVVVEFTTVHRLCPACQRGNRRRRLAVGLAHKLLFATMMLLLFGTVPFLVFLVAVPFVAPETTWGFLAGAVSGVSLLALTVWGFEACRRWLIPRSLRQVGRFPFRLSDARPTA